MSPLARPRAIPHALAAAASAAAVLLASGCTLIADTPAGTPLAELQQRYGAPAQVCPQPDGGQRVIWSQQPNGQHAWAATLAPDGRTVGAVEPVLTDAAFARLAVGTTASELRCTYGPPAIVAKLGRGQRPTVWSYRYREAKAWDSLMHVYLDPNGQVTHFHPGPDPMFEEGGFWWR